MKQRFVTGIPAAVGFLAVLVLGNLWFALLMAGLSLIGYYEFLTINRIRRFGPTAITGFVGMSVIILQGFPFAFLPSYDWIAVVWILLAVMLFITVATKNRETIDHAALGFLGVLYIGFGFHYMMVTRLEYGLALTILVFGCVWLSDIGAYFAGRAFGRTKLWPSISPNKTIEGAIGGMAMAIVFAVCWSLARPDDLAPSTALLLGLAAAIAGQSGDLIESALKRVRDVKDSGTLLPGHGGVLDRVDSWLLVFPIVHVLQILPAV
ncbi:phosphatidate cytidylyltransferase [Xylanibacillus composti]|uniref:Phosphatidate cytidylyltransferase n=1 Tax=Xylanibacillus composti TaxID=1572762 RepID=A0A8J4H0F1_9BACL|nr:phosphatidate cytidylyltransferase [Xylanibacillus composti]GIQ68608.1 phosphatidate cytidylyltransferase [Xylanibacillus composti]